MTNTDKNTVLIQNVENFKSLGVMGNIEGLDAWLENNSYGIVSLDQDADGEYGWVALVAPQDGPDFVMDSVTGEMEPVENIDPDVELAVKMDIAMELEDDTEDFEINPVAWTPPAATTAVEADKPARTRNITNIGNKMKAHQYLQALIQANPGISRTEVFSNQELRDNLLDGLVQAKINTSDKLEIKRYNRRLNRFIRQMRRDGVDIQIERKGRIAHYTIGEPSGQLELPFDAAAEARNSAIIGDDVSNVTEEEIVPPKFIRADEESNQMLDFEALLAALDEEAVAPVAK